jgi:hypothetical protein
MINGHIQVWGFGIKGLRSGNKPHQTTVRSYNLYAQNMFFANQ